MDGVGDPQIEGTPQIPTGVTTTTLIMHTKAAAAADLQLRSIQWYGGDGTGADGREDGG